MTFTERVDFIDMEDLRLELEELAPNWERMLSINFLSAALRPPADPLLVLSAFFRSFSFLPRKSDDAALVGIT